MTHGTKKVGIAGKYGSRYGVKIRKRLKETETERVQKRTCPRCAHLSVKRKDTGVWLCRHCGYKYAAGAYVPKIREFKREDLLAGAGAKEETKPAAKKAKAPKERTSELAEEEIAPESEVEETSAKGKGAKK